MMNFNWLFDTPIAHRGLHTDKLPENSIGAFQNAIDNGLSVEMDIHLSADNQLVVFHDDNLKRVCGVDKKVKDCTVSELKSYKLAGTDFTIPTFDEFLDLVDGKIGILCEIKGIIPWDVSIAKAVVERVKTYKGNIALQSFNFGAVNYFRKNPLRPYGQLCSWHGTGDKGRSHIADLFGKLWIMKISKPQFVAYDVRALDKKYPENKYVKKHLKDTPFIIWTVKDDEKLESALEYGNNLIFENMPVEKIRSRFNERLPLNK
ncbi:MAG: glycerophosphodiester phosphodiesterase family protein [Clostridia bacterium]